MSVTPYQHLTNFIAKNKFKRGAFEGEAPLIRRENLCRIKPIGDELVQIIIDGHTVANVLPHSHIRFYNTFTLNRPSRMNKLNYALHQARIPLYVTTKRVCGMTQPIVNIVSTGYVLLADGLELGPKRDTTGSVSTITNFTYYSPLQEFRARRADTARRKEVIDEIKASGFFDVYPILYANSTPRPGDARPIPINASVATTLSSPEQADRWPDIVYSFKFVYGYNYSAGGYGWSERDNDSMQATRRRIVKSVTDHLTKTTLSGKYLID
jgi:hypothetical protein